ncbi:MAG: sulfotransferase family 2 domain-containing protein [Gammaproteobacteria bacterium]|nr:sulfotransferase family 2 domain-containing protein [Gammaproteobacteria bacterium]
MLSNLLNRSPDHITIDDFRTDVRFGSLPLIDPKFRFMLFFSAKVGSTFISKWFFEQIGKLNEALEYSHWIHNYRIKVYYKSPQYKQDLKRALAKQTKMIKLVRCPYQRAVSSYFHCLRHEHFYDVLSDFIGKPFNKDYVFTFEEFVDYLNTLDISKCNPHFRSQTWKHEKNNRMKFHHIIKIENSIDEFKRLESDFSLRNTDLLRHTDSKHHIEKKQGNGGYCGDNRKIDLRNPMNQYSDFFNESTINLISKIYYIDFETYGYSKVLVQKSAESY